MKLSSSSPRAWGLRGPGSERLREERVPLHPCERVSHFCGAARFAGDTAGWSLAGQDTLPEPSVPFSWVS